MSEAHNNYFTKLPSNFDKQPRASLEKKKRKKNEQSSLTREENICDNFVCRALHLRQESKAYPIKDWPLRNARHEN